MTDPTPPPNHTPAATAAADVIHQQTHPWMAGPCTACIRLGYLIVDRLTADPDPATAPGTVHESPTLPLAIVTAGRSVVFEAVGEIDAASIRRGEHALIDLRTYLPASTPPYMAALMFRDAALNLRDSAFGSTSPEMMGE